MAIRFLRRLWKNLGTVLLSFTLSIAVWISAVVASDPNEACSQPKTVTLEVIGQDEDLLIIGELPAQVTISLQAPGSICRELASQPGLVHASINLTNRREGAYQLPIELEIDTQPVRILEILPHNVDLYLEAQVSVEHAIKVILVGEPARGFQTEATILDIEEVNISGPASLLEQVVEVWAELDISDAREAIIVAVSLVAVDENGQEIIGLILHPDSVQVNQPIVQARGFRTVVVLAETVGQPASGYRLTTIQVSPPTVTISSSDPEQVESLPGFVSTLPLDLSNLTENEEVRLSLDLPPGVFVEGEQTVLVFVGITAIEGTTRMTIPVEIIGLASGLGTQISLETVDVFLSGPVAILNSLTVEDVRIFVDLTEITEVGKHLVELTIEILADRIQLDSINPPTVEVVVIIQLTPIVTPTENATPSP